MLDIHFLLTIKATIFVYSRVVLWEAIQVPQILHSVSLALKSAVSLAAQQAFALPVSETITLLSIIAVFFALQASPIV